MSVRIFDSMQRKKIEFVPLVPGKVGLYSCGPTVYNFLHLGNGRPLVVFDVVARHLRQRGYEVTAVRNITDVDDKIIRRAAELDITPTALVEQFAKEFERDVTALGCLPPTFEPRVTRHINEIVALITKLIERGQAYESAGDVYFAVGKFAPYGELSHQPLDELKAGARVDVGEKKNDPLDFALWKAAKPGEPAWPSPWGNGRPGWHIECSAMAERYLGQSFDIHGGGVDLTFPHHENERAQSQGANGNGTFARYWMHNGFVNWGSGKISKSDASAKVLFDRAFRMRVLIERHGGEALRYFLLSTQYKNPISFDVDIAGDDMATAPLAFPGLEEAERKLEYGYLALERLQGALSVGKAAGAGAIAPEAETWLAALQDALDDDFNTAAALASIGEAWSLTNRILDGKLALAKDCKRRTLERLQQDLQIGANELGLFETAPTTWLAAHRVRRAALRGIDPAWVDGKIAARNEARKAKDFTTSDAIRDELKIANIEIMDNANGTTWRVT